MNPWGNRFVPRTARIRLGALVSGAIVAAGLAGVHASADLPLPACTSQLPPTVSAPNGATMLFDDEFTAPNGTKACPLKWNYELGGSWSNDEQQGYSTNNSYGQIDNDGSGNGYLSINAKNVTYSDPAADALGQNPPYTSARLDTFGSFQFTYGHIEARIQAAGGTTWPAFWLLGTGCPPTYDSSQNVPFFGPAGEHVAWPACGELDVMEIDPGTTSVERATMHFPKIDASQFSTTTPLAVKSRWEPGVAYNAGTDLTQSWHTYAADIQNNKISFSFDGHVIKTFCGRLNNMGQGGTPNGNVWAADHPWYVLLNVAVPPAGDGSPFHDGPASKSAFVPGSMKVDYVRAWTDPSYNEQAAC